MMSLPRDWPPQTIISVPVQASTSGTRLVKPAGGGAICCHAFERGSKRPPQFPLELPLQVRTSVPVHAISFDEMNPPGAGTVCPPQVLDGGSKSPPSLK